MSDGHINVAVRVRPLLEREEENGEVSVLEVVQPSPDDTTGKDPLIRVLRPLEGVRGGNTSSRTRATSLREVQVQEFAFDCCVGPTVPQEQLFSLLDIASYCDDALVEGKAATVMCFGQTGSGKTFTMSGRTLSEQEVAAQQEGAAEGEEIQLVSEDGLQYKAARYMARRLQEVQRQGGGATVQVRASYMELYNEAINDLLQGSTGLKCRWAAASKQFFVEGLMLVECESEEDLLLVLREGQANRQRSAHLLNADSSRSHVLFTMYAETHSPDAPTKYGKITFVDLAGSECLKDTGSDVKETRSINQSLFALGNVLERLSELQRQRLRGGGGAGAEPGGKKDTKKKSAHVDYRSSVLTQLLMDSLNGNCRTLMVACATPSNRFVDESLRTIHYAQRTRSITAAPAQRVNLEEKARHEQREEIRRLKKENALLRRYLGLPATGALEEADVAAAAAALLAGAPVAVAAPAPRAKAAEEVEVVLSPPAGASPGRKATVTVREEATGQRRRATDGGARATKAAGPPKRGSEPAPPPPPPPRTPSPPTLPPLPAAPKVSATPTLPDVHARPAESLTASQPPPPKISALDWLNSLPDSAPAAAAAAAAAGAAVGPKEPRVMNGYGFRPVT